MNIKEAKEQIKNAMKAYFTRDEAGEPVIPVEKQRPVFLMGPPGIGKTAVMEQIAAELGVGLVSYSMTHHTRQSALGLPFIEKKVYGGKEYSVSEYTMSEIIASVYDQMEQTGLKEGILFLDEINCVSETLAPSMLQFLQYKIFGRHRVPDGWIVVTAGNPPEYNNSVREFDIVTWDRLKRIDVEPDFAVWKEYAVNSGVHTAILTYLEIKPPHFYKVESGVDGKIFVTARGWCDLSDMIRLYEKNGIKVDGKLISQYLQDPKIARDFAVYFDLWEKYRSDYQVEDILSGKASEAIRARAKVAKFDERLTLIGLMMDKIKQAAGNLQRQGEVLSDLIAPLRELKTMPSFGDGAGAFLRKKAAEKRAAAEKGRLASSLSPAQQRTLLNSAKVLEELAEELAAQGPGKDPFAAVKAAYDGKVKAMRRKGGDTKAILENVFAFCEEVFGSDSREILILVTELTVDRACVAFLSRFGCDAYFRHNKELLFYERKKELIREIEVLDLTDAENA
ncbi:MAG: AAA family ATPase [Clostridia bacterium]|nr:AAA family ATPase [Clostridia bacterium]